MRKRLKYPPFCDIIVIGISSEKQQDGKKITQTLHNYLKNRVVQENLGIILYKGMPAPIDKIKNKYRFRIIIKCKFDDNMIEIINDVLEQYQQMKESKISLARVSKNICYFIAPVFGLILIACIAGLIIMDTEIELENTSNYYDTKIFSDNYLSSIYANTYIPTFLNEETSKEQNNSQGDAIDMRSYGYDIQENVQINDGTGIIWYKTDNNSNFKYLFGI